MDGIDATRSSTGESVTIALDDEGRVSARTPDGSVLQTKTVKASRLKLKERKLTWSGVSYEVEDEDEARAFLESLTEPRRTRRLVPMIALFVAGLLLGALGGVFLLDRAPSANCDEARDIVGVALANMEQINEAEEQDQSFFAAISVEQRTVTYTMASEPSCFSLTERAQAEGLLEGIRGLLRVAPG